MKKKILVIITLLIAFLVGGCQSETADMSGYKRLTEKHIYKETNVDEMKQMMDNKDSFVVYLGFENCPWCKEAVPVLNRTAKKAGMTTVYYIDTRKEDKWQSNLDSYDTLVEMVGDYLDYDEEGIKHLYVPFVVFVKDGEVVFTHQGTVETHDNPEVRPELTEEEATLLEEIYMEGFDKMK